MSITAFTAIGLAIFANGFASLMLAILAMIVAGIGFGALLGAPTHYIVTNAVGLLSQFLIVGRVLGSSLASGIIHAYATPVAVYRSLYLAYCAPRNANTPTESQATWVRDIENTSFIANALEAVRMGDFASRHSLTLSSGERQRIWIAMALAQEAPVFLLDESTGHLDVRVAPAILGLLRERARAGATIQCAIHDLNEAAAFTDRMLLFGCEEMLACDAPDRLFASRHLEAACGSFRLRRRSAQYAVSTAVGLRRIVFMDSMSRKDALKSLIVLPAMAALGAALAQPAEAKGTKAQYKYQDEPHQDKAHGREMCANCRLFVPGKEGRAANGPGECRLVAGTISPRGWCIDWSMKAR